MPSCQEIRDDGQNNLACAISKRQRFAAWANIFGVPMKDSDTKRGWAAEERVASELHAAGLNSIRQRTRAPFDIQAGPVRINVKSASFHSYGKVGAWFMGMGKSALHCDVFAFVRYDRPDLPTLWIRSKDASQGTLSLTMNHRFNYMSLSIAPGSPLWEEMSRPAPEPAAQFLPSPPLHKSLVAILRATANLATGFDGFIPHGPHEWRATHRLHRKGLIQNSGLMHCGWDDCPRPSPHESEAFTITDAGRAELAKQETP